MQWRGVIMDDKTLRVTEGFPQWVGSQLKYEAEVDEEYAKTYGLSPAGALRPGAEVTFLIEGMLDHPDCYAAELRLAPPDAARGFLRLQASGFLKKVKAPKKKELLVEFVARAYVSNKDAEAHRIADHVALLEPNRASVAVAEALMDIAGKRVLKDLTSSSESGNLRISGRRANDDTPVELSVANTFDFVNAVDAELSLANVGRSLCVLNEADAAEDQIVVLALTKAQHIVMHELQLLLF